METTVSGRGRRDRGIRFGGKEVGREDGLTSGAP